MKEGGNRLINRAFEANLTENEKTSVKPNNHTDLDERSKFIYDKYQYRRWYSEDAFKKITDKEKKQVVQQKRSAEEEDFFKARTAKNSNSRGERLAAQGSDENDWWKNDGSKGGKRKDEQPSGAQMPSNSMGPLGDRRNLLSTLQMESKSRVMSDLAGLGIARPSQIKAKASLNNRKERKNEPNLVPRENRSKQSKSPGRNGTLRKAPNRSKSASSVSSEESISRNDRKGNPSCQLDRKAAPGRSSSGPVLKVSGDIDAPSADPQPKRNSRPGRDLNRAQSFDDCTRKKGISNRSRSSSVKRSRGAARKNRTLVASQYDGSLMDSIAVGLATVDSTEGASTVRSGRRRRGDEESHASTRRGDEKSIATYKSGRSIARSEVSQTSSRRSSSNRKRQSPKRRKDGTSGSISRTPSPDLTHNSRRRVSQIDASPPTPTKGAPIKIKRVPKDLKPRTHPRTAKSPMRN